MGENSPNLVTLVVMHRLCRVDVHMCSDSKHFKSVVSDMHRYMW
jgi:hypothetical protein